MWGHRFSGKSRLGWGITGDLYGFADSSMTSLVAQFGGARRVALAAGGVAGQDRAPVRVAAHMSCRRLAVGLVAAHRSESLRTRLGRRLAAAFGGCLRSRAGPPAGSTARGCPRAEAEGLRPATVRLCFGFVRGSVALSGGGWSVGRRVSWVPRHVSALRKQTGPVASSRIAVAGHRFRSAGHHRPGQLGYARRRGEGPRTQPPCGEGSTERHGRFSLHRAAGRQRDPPRATELRHRTAPPRARPSSDARSRKSGAPDL